MSKVILICGKICSGKTYYARQLRERENAVLLSTDEVAYDLTDNAQGEGYSAFAKRVNAYLLKKTAERPGNGRDIPGSVDPAGGTVFFSLPCGKLRGLLF